MKTNRFSIFKLALYAFAALSFIGCEPKEDDKEDVQVEDGYYVVGEGTAITALDPNGLMKVTRNEVLQEDRAQLMELYIAVKAGSGGFNIVQVEGKTKKTLGPGTDFALVDSATKDKEEPTTFWRGALVESETKFTVPEDGLYHVIIDTELGKVAVARVIWGVIGAATPNGWSGSTPLVQKAFDLNSMTFEIAEITMLANEYKFRYSDGWKIILDAEKDLGTGKKGIKVNTNFGGTLAKLVPGGDNMKIDEYGIYKISVTWTLGTGTTAAVSKIRDAEPLPTYPEAVYMVGDATAYAWETPGTKPEAVMHKCAGGAPSEGIYWKICYIEADKGFKISAGDWKEPNLGFGNVTEFDVDGVTVSDAGGNMKVAESNLYIVVLNMRDSKYKVSVKPAEVYGIGDAFGGWDENVAANKFTLSTKSLVSPALTAAGNIRMYAEHAWIPAWWNSEFRVADGKIDYRNDGGDQAAVAGTLGQVVTLNFDDNTGLIQ